MSRYNLRIISFYHYSLKYSILINFKNRHPVKRNFLQKLKLESSWNEILFTEEFSVLNSDLASVFFQHIGFLNWKFFRKITHCMIKGCKNVWNGKKYMILILFLTQNIIYFIIIISFISCRLHVIIFLFRCSSLLKRSHSSYLDTSYRFQWCLDETSRRVNH